MSEKLDLYVSFDGGATFVTPQYEITGTYGIQNETNPFIFRKFLDLTVNFYGNSYDSIYSKILAGESWLPFQTKYVGTANIFAEGKMLIRSKLDASRKIVTVSTFKITDEYTEIEKARETKVSLFNVWNTGKQISVTVFGQYLDNIAIEVPNSVSFNDYKLLYRPDGNPVIFGDNSGFEWSFFTFVSTETIGSNVKYHAQTVEGQFNVYGGGLSKINWLGGFKYVRTTFTNWTFDLVRNNDCIPIIQLIEYICSELGLSYSVEQEADLAKYSVTDINRLFINDTIPETEEIELSLNDVFSILADLMQYHWYIETTQIKFKHISELAYNTEVIDIRTYFKQNLGLGKSQIEYVDVEKPLFERWQPQNANTYGFAPLQITYNQNENLNTETKSISITCDLQHVWNNFTNAEKGLILLSDNEDTPATLTSDIPAPNYIWIYNIKASWQYLLSLYLLDYRPFDSGVSNFSGTSISLNPIRSQPIFKQALESYYLSEFINNNANSIFTDTGIKYITTDMGEGKINKVTIDVRSSLTRYEIEYYEI